MILKMGALLELAAAQLGYTWLLLLTTLAAAVFFWRILRLPGWAACLWAAAPVLCLAAPVPLADAVLDQYPLLPYLLAFLAVLPLAAGSALAAALSRRWDLDAAGSRVFCFLVTLIILGITALLLWGSWQSENLLREAAVTLAVGLFVLAFTLVVFRLRLGGLVLSTGTLALLVLSSEAMLTAVPEGTLVPAVPGPPKVQLVNSANERVKAFLLPEQQADAIRIAVLSSGAPSDLPQPYPYPAQLEILMNAYTPDSRFQVVELSADDISSYQLLELAQRALTDFDPSILVVSGWLNDAMPGRNGFGLVGLSEYEAAREMAERQRLAQIPFYTKLFGSRVFQSLRYMWGGSTDTAPAGTWATPRVSPTEHQQLFGRIAAAAQAQGALALFFHQPVAAGPEAIADEYRQAIQAAAANAVFAEVDELFKEPAQGLLFKADGRFTPLGHRLTAEKLFETILEIEPFPPLLTAALTDIRQRRQHLQHWAVKGAELDREVILPLQIDEEPGRFYRVAFSLNDHFVGARRLDQPGPVRFRFNVPAHYRELPVLTAQLQVISAGGENLGAIGSTGAVVFTPITLKAGATGAGYISFTESYRLPVPQESDVFQITVLDRETSNYLSGAAFSDAAAAQAELATLIRQQAWGAVVLLSTIRAPTQPITASLERALAYLGADRAPQPGQSYLLAGAAGAAAGQALTQSGSGDLVLTLGREVPRRYRAATQHPLDREI